MRCEVANGHAPGRSSHVSGAWQWDDLLRERNALYAQTLQARYHIRIRIRTPLLSRDAAALLPRMAPAGVRQIQFL